MGNIDSVKDFLRGQNLEQLGRMNEALELYEKAVADGFDSSGPYDRLIRVFADRAQHTDVVRVAEAAIANVHTYPDKIAWYELMRAEAIKAQTKVPKTIRKGDAGSAG